jgi:hypothetical protein
MRAQVIVDRNNIKFTTEANGDRIMIRRVHLTSDNASKLAQLINSQNRLKVIIKDDKEGE